MGSSRGKSRANERRAELTRAKSAAEIAALRWPFGLPSGREHFVVLAARPLKKSSARQHSTLPFVEADGAGAPSLQQPGCIISHRDTSWRCRDGIAARVALALRAPVRSRALRGSCPSASGVAINITQGRGGRRGSAVPTAQQQRHHPSLHFINKKDAL